MSITADHVHYRLNLIIAFKLKAMTPVYLAYRNGEA